MGKTRLDLTSVGEALIQLAPPVGTRLRETETLQVNTAGAEANVAMGVARMGHRSAFVTRLGCDPFGDRLIAELRQSGVDCTSVRRDDVRPTGVYFKDYVGGRTVMHYYRQASAATAMEPQDLLPLVGATKWFHVSGITAALSPSCGLMVRQLLEVARKAGTPVSFDVNYRTSLWPDDDAAGVLMRLARMAHTVFVGRDEAETLWNASDAGDIRAILPDVRRLVIKDSSVGATSFTSEVVFVPALSVPVVESVGAGDAFAAGFLSALLRGRGDSTALRWGHLMAARALVSTADQGLPPSSDLLSMAADTDEQGWSSQTLVARLREEASDGPTDLQVAGGAGVE